jgi:hypothetical protein
MRRLPVGHDYRRPTSIQYARCIETAPWPLPGDAWRAWYGDELDRERTEGQMLEAKITHATPSRTRPHHQTTHRPHITTATETENPRP